MNRTAIILVLVLSMVALSTQQVSDFGRGLFTGAVASSVFSRGFGRRGFGGGFGGITPFFGFGTGGPVVGFSPWGE